MQTERCLHLLGSCATVAVSSEAVHELYNMMGCSSILLGTCHVVASLFVMKEHTSGKDESCSVS